ncbi:DUF5668 domain-containing protein [Undibacterium sp. RTI2.2]|nr:MULTISPECIES: DUF5668 domain-containing protein [unclassified Undibacterium]MDY7536689.1 DUF5668 domain-containing protein [Undibacterium sp. 5I1]MEB0118553.1 DUF5668 domain-containing protein [Undibacterium sp. RTI2.2]MEB0230266.1 DUF5668 domain-containing protein [Undibacterium sp. 10I3]MEB0257966.1 DUF5668 domain-containing protein [Undibacterium sp. 5I1]
MNSDISQASIQQYRKQRQRKSVIWGLVLIAVGTIFLLERLGYVDLHPYIGEKIRWWYGWPLVIAIVGLVEALSATMLVQVIKGISQIAIGLWLYVCLTQLWDWTFQTSWPIILIIFGVTWVATGITNLSEKSNKESQS